MNAVTHLPPPTPKLKPRLSVRTAALFVRMPAVEQWKVLQEQKFPHPFKPQFYRASREAMSRVLEGDYASARARAQRPSRPTERMHNMRVVESLITSLRERQLKPASQKRYSLDLVGLELKLSPDLFAYEGVEERYMYFNYTTKQFDPEAARMTLELAHWVLEHNGVKVKPRQLEFYDLFTGALHTGKTCRARTKRLLEENAKLIESMWPAIEP
jgi:hypothetical protein